MDKMSIFTEDLELPLNEESEDDDEEQRNKELNNRLANFDDTLGSSDDEAAKEGDGDQELRDQINRSTEGNFAPNGLDFPQLWSYDHPFTSHEMQTSTPYDYRHVPPLETPQTAFAAKNYEDPHLSDDRRADLDALQTPSTAYVPRNYQNLDGNPYVGYMQAHRTPSVDKAPECYRERQGIEESYGDAVGDGNCDTVVNFNNSAQCGFRMQPFEGGDHYQDRTVTSPNQRHSKEFSDVYEEKDNMHLDAEQRFYHTVGSTVNGEIEKLKGMVQLKCDQLESLQKSLDDAQEELRAKTRSSAHMKKLFEAEKNDLTSDLKKKQTEVDNCEGELRRLDSEVKSVRDENEKLLKRCREADCLMDSMRTEIESLKSTDTLARMKQQCEDVVAQLKDKHEGEVSKLKEELESFKVLSQEKEERIKRLTNDMEDRTRSYEKEKLERIDTINKLTKALHESQDQCQQMLLKGGSAMRSFSSRNVEEIEEFRAKQQESESLNKTLREENEDLKLKLAEKEELLLNDLLSAISQKKVADDSYAQLNIKRPSIDTEELERFFSSKVNSIEKLMSLLAATKSHNATLREDVKKARDEQKRMVKEFESAKNSFKEVACDGTCASASTLKHEIQNLRTEIKKLSSSKKKLDQELDKKGDVIRQLEGDVARHEARMSRLAAEFNEEKQEALEGLEAQWAEKFQTAIEAHEMEVVDSLRVESESLRKQLLESEVQLSRVQQDYLKCCEERHKFEEEHNLVWEKKIEEMKQVHMAQLSSLKEIYSLRRKCPTKDTSTQLGADVVTKSIQVSENLSKTSELEETISELKSSLLLERKCIRLEKSKLQLEDDLRERESKIKELNQVVDKTGKDLNGMKSAYQNLEKQNQQQATKMKQKTEEEMLVFVRNLIQKKGLKLSEPSEIPFNETWSWTQKIGHLLSMLPETKNEVITADQECFESYQRKIEEYEKESISYLSQNIELNNKNSKLLEDLNAAGVQLKQLKKLCSENDQDIVKLKEALEKYRHERRSLYADTKKLEAKVKELEKAGDETKMKLESEKDGKIKSLLESESFLQNNLQEALEKLTSTRKSLEELEERSKKRLNEMAKSMEREKEETIKQLKKCFQTQLAQKDKEKKILDELLKDSEFRSQKEIKTLKKKLEEVTGEKNALEKCDLGDQIKKYKDNVEEVRLYYNERVHALEVEKKKYKRARDKVSSTVKQYYIRHMRDFLRGRFDSSSAVEIMAHVEVHLDGIPALMPNEETPSIDMSQPSLREHETTRRSSSPASSTSSVVSRPPLHPCRPSTQASDASSYRFYTRGLRNHSSN